MIDSYDRQLSTGSKTGFDKKRFSFLKLEEFYAIYIHTAPAQRGKCFHIAGLIVRYRATACDAIWKPGLEMQISFP